MASLISLGVFSVFLIVGAYILTQMYNRLILLKNRCDNSFAQIEVQLKRRYDLIPNLVEAVKAYLQHEHETLEDVIAARNQAAAGLSKATKAPTNAKTIQAFMNSENALAGAIGRMNFVMEQYPELKANESISELTEELSHTENRIAFSRQSYNDLTMVFNTFRQSFPTVMFAAMFGFAKDRDMLEFADTEQIQDAPEVSLV